MKRIPTLMKFFYWSKKYIDKELNISNWAFDISESIVVPNKAFSWDIFVFFSSPKKLKNKNTKNSITQQSTASVC